MKSKFLLIPALLLGATALGGAAVALAHKNVARAAKAAELSPSTITDSMYEVAFLEQYNGGTEYGYTNDKPLAETNALGGHIYGDVGGARKENFSTNLLYGVNETSTWTFTCGRVKNDTTNGFITFGVETHGTTGNILDSAAYPEGTDGYAIGQLTIGSSTTLTECSAMIMDNYIDELNDFSVFWRNNAYGSKFSICYQIFGGEWKRLSNTASGNYTGTRGWDAHGYSTFKSDGWTGKDLYRQKVRLAFAVTNAGTDHGNFRPSAIVINANKAAVKYLNALTYREGVCTTSSQFDLNLSATDNRHNQDLFQLATERADGAFLADYICTGTKTSAYYILDLYNHLVTSIPSLGSVKVASSNYFMNMTNNASVVIIVSVSVAAAAVIGTGLFFGLRKRKHN